MRNINELKQGDKIYDIDYRQVKRYAYLCVHPKGHGTYHILIDGNEDPIRIYGERLQDILNKGFKTYQEAKMGLASDLEDKAKRLRLEDEAV